MRELKCSNCSSNDFKIEHGLYVCQNCGSKFVPDGNDPLKEIQRLHDRMMEKFIKDDYEKALELSKEVLELDNTDAYAHAIRGGCELAFGIKNYNVRTIVESFENALKYAQDDEAEDIRTFVSKQMNYSWERLYENDRYLENRIIALTKV